MLPAIILIGVLLFFFARSFVIRAIELRKATKYEKDERYEDALEIYMKVYKNNREKYNEIEDEMYDKIQSRDYRKSLEAYNRALELYIQGDYEEAMCIIDAIDFDIGYSVEEKIYNLYEKCSEMLSKEYE